MGCEIWLCRVLLHPGPVRGPLRVQDLKPDAHQAVLAKIVNGEFGALPDGCIVEPVTSHATEEDANAARVRAMHDKPEDDWRVVITMAVGR